MLRVDRSRTLGMVVAVMLLGLFMNASVTGAFATSGWAFVVPCLLIQLGRTSWGIVNAPDAVTGALLPDPPVADRRLPFVDRGCRREPGGPPAVVGLPLPAVPESGRPNRASL